MAFISITRLRLRSVLYLPGFALHALRSNRQVRRSPGFRTGSLLGDAHSTFWTMTVWNDEDAMRAYMSSGAHRIAMPKLARWCDEASVVHWNAETPPDWREAADRMRNEGRPSRLRHPSPLHQAMQFVAPKQYKASLKLAPKP